MTDETSESRPPESLRAEAAHDAMMVEHGPPRGSAPGPREPTLYITDAELIRRLGVPEKLARIAIETLDLSDGRNSGFPQKSKFWGNRRYWPAVKLWLDRHNGLIVDALPQRRAG